MCKSSLSLLVSTSHWSISGYKPLYFLPLNLHLHGASLYLNSSFYLIYTSPTFKNLRLSPKNSTNTPDVFPFIQHTPLAMHLMQVLWPQEHAPLLICRTSLQTWIKLLHQTYCLPKVLHLQVFRQVTVLPHNCPI